MASAADLLAGIPDQPEYTALRNIITLLGNLFEDDLGEISEARLAGWVAEIGGGQGRDASEIRNDILRVIVGQDAIADTMGVSDEEAAQLITGELTFAELGYASSNLGGVATINETQIPDGATLVKVNQPSGSDAAALYYLVYETSYGTFSFEVGDLERVEDLFGSTGRFGDQRTFTQEQYDRQGYTAGGAVDVILGAEEGLESQIERGISLAGLEDLPEWIDRSDEAKALIGQSAIQGWSSGRLWTELSKTDTFTQRFGSVFELYSSGGRTIEEAVTQIIADENALIDVMRRYQAPGTTVDLSRVQGAMVNGWTPQQASAVLEATNQITRNPTALAQANQILAASGIDRTLTQVDLTRVLLGTAPDDITEALNTTFAAQALAEAGLGDVDVDLLIDVVDDTTRLLDPEAYRDIAQGLAFNFARFGTELDRNKLGISEAALTAAAFGQEAPDGTTVGETLNLLARFERDRRAGASGNVQVGQSFTDEQGRLRILGA